MSSYMVLSRVSEELRRILWEAYNADPVVQPIVGSEAAIVFSNPTETARDSANRLSIWLYQITENEFLKNQPMQRTNGPTTTQDMPLALNLHYLITPFAATPEADHRLLGLTLQTLYDNAITPLRRPVEDISEELRVIFCRMSLEELTRVWEALREPYRLSIAYTVRVTRIDSRRVPQRARVLEANNEYGSVPEAVGE
ncbi:MAG TPA: DUF4255 domain-containing protein [Roseiflexaceae bacterium]|jgi:hypothetical protein|nr:DUF4255 domain-containing protein [Roseiflexaceae bacterium]